MLHAGNDLTEEITPIEAGLKWTIGKRRRDACDFLGGEVHQIQLEDTSIQPQVTTCIYARAPVRGTSGVLATAARAALVATMF